MAVAKKKPHIKRLVRARRPLLSIAQILAWADDHHERTGRWPTNKAGYVQGTSDEKWRNVCNALRLGLRGLEGGSSLARLLAEHRGYRNIHGLPALSIEQILIWADAFRERTGEWPCRECGRIEEGPPGETWATVEVALIAGSRGLPEASSLATLLEVHRGVRNPANLLKFTEELVLHWADSFFEHNGYWPHENSGAVLEAPDETWQAVTSALARGLRGMPGGSSLAKFLQKHRGVRNRSNLPDFTVAGILEWADAHFRQTGQWPTQYSGQVRDAPGETWTAVQVALLQGCRGLPGGESLARLLEIHRGVRNHLNLPPFNVTQILRWSDQHFARTGRWPTLLSGKILDASGETWAAVDAALSQGHRGLPGGETLANLLAIHRQKNVKRTRLSCRRILAWVDAHLRNAGEYPTKLSGAVKGAPGETWGAIDEALLWGTRGLPKVGSLAQLLQQNNRCTFETADTTLLSRL